MKKEVNEMEEKMLDILVEIQKNVNLLQMDMKVVKSDIHEIKNTVNRIEVAQNEDVIGLLKITKKKTDFEMDYVNNKLTEMDKRLFILEKR
jgi:hypothetical protein